MSDDRYLATASVVKDLCALEKASRQTLRASAKLVQTMATAHEAGGFAFHEGQAELLSACRLVMQEGERIAPIAKLHRQMAVFAVRRGIDWRMGGDVGPTNYDDVRGELLAAGEQLPDPSNEAKPGLRAVA